MVPLNEKRDTKGEKRGRKREGAKDKEKERQAEGGEEEDERRPMSVKEMEEADASRYRETRMEREKREGKRVGRRDGAERK